MKNLKYKIINSKAIYFIFVCIQYIFRIFPIKRNKILFQNFNGKGYGDNPKYIANELIKKNKYNLVWVVKSISEDAFPKEIKQVKKYSLNYFYQISTSKMWISNNRLENFITKRKRQIYIQTWHGGLGLKKIEKDAEDKLDKKYIKSSKKDSKMIDYAISNSSYRTNLFKKSFWYDGEILELGCPRNDIFFNKRLYKSIKNKVAKLYGIDTNKKIILYVPTFRKNLDFNYETFNFKEMITRLNKYKDNFVLCVKLHPNVKSYIETSSNIYNVSDYSDTDELLLISDIVISDYSSAFFDFLYMNRPIYLYAPDYAEYVKERGFYFDYKNLPFSISYTSDELIKKICEDDYLNYSDRLHFFLKEVNVVDDGHASQRIANFIDHLLKGEKNEKI